MDPDLAIDDELQPGQADALVGQPGEGEGLLGSADVHHDLDRYVGHRAELGALDGEVEQALVDQAGVTLGARDGDFAAVSEGLRAGAGADDGRDAELASDDRGVTGASAAVGDDRGGPLHDRLPIGVGHVGDEHLALDELVHLVDRGQHADGAGADLLPDRATLDQHLDTLRRRCCDAKPLLGAHPTRLHGLGPRLEHVDESVDTVATPLDVHRAAVVLLDDQRVAGKLGDLGVGEAQQLGVGGVDRHELRGATDARVGRVDHLGGLATNPALEDGRSVLAQGRLVDIELVGVDRALHDALAEAVGRRHENGVLEAGLGVHREHHPRGADVGAHHLLHAGRQRDVGVREAVVHAIGDRAVVVERGEDLADGEQHRVDAAHVEEGLLLAGEGGVRQVLGGGRRADGEGRLGTRLPGQAVVGRADVGLEVGRERHLDDRGADLRADLGEPAYVVGVEAVEQAGDAFGQAALPTRLRADEPVERAGRRGEAVGHPHPEPAEVRHHLAQRGVLATDLLEVAQAEVGEPPHIGMAHVGGRGIGGGLGHDVWPRASVLVAGILSGSSRAALLRWRLRMPPFFLSV